MSYLFYLVVCLLFTSHCCPIWLTANILKYPNQEEEEEGGEEEEEKKKKRNEEAEGEEEDHHWCEYNVVIAKFQASRKV